MFHLEVKDYYGKSPYGTYGYGNYPAGGIHNYLNHNGKTILVLHGSFWNCVVPFLALGTEDTREVDLRLFPGSLKKYMEIHKPDFVIVMYNQMYTSTVPDWSSHNYTYDFR